MYIGLRRERARGQEYDDFIDEFMFACTGRYGPRVLLQVGNYILYLSLLYIRP